MRGSSPDIVTTGARASQGEQPGSGRGLSWWRGGEGKMTREESLAQAQQVIRSIVASRHDRPSLVAQIACEIGAEVLCIVDDEGLQQNAHLQGQLLHDGLRQLQQRHMLIGDVRGRGLFLGVELVTDRTTKDPATALAGYVSNRLRDHRILIGTDGPHDNVLKIRPPLTIGAADCELLLARLDDTLLEANLLN